MAKPKHVIEAPSGRTIETTGNKRYLSVLDDVAHPGHPYIHTRSDNPDVAVKASNGWPQSFVWDTHDQKVIHRNTTPAFHDRRRDS